MLIAGVAIIIFVVLGAVHLYWAFGGTTGKASAIPTRGGVPVLHAGPIGTLLVAVVLFALAAVLAIRVGWIILNPLVATARVGAWLISGLFGLRAIGDFRYVGFFKSVRDSRFARLDDLIYSPLCVVLALFTGLVAVS